MNSTNLTPAQAAERILGFYDNIPAMAPKAFAAGLVEILSSYPQPVIDRAASASRGLAGAIAYPNLAKFKEKLDVWANEWWDEQQAIKRANTLKLPEPPEDPEMKARIAKGLSDLVQHLKSGFGPSTA
jgi:hypothetical protein